MTTDRRTIALKSRTIAEQYAEKMILRSDPLRPLWNREAVLFNKPPRWNYIDSCMISAILRLMEINGDSRLLDYAIRFTDAYLETDGTIPTMEPLDYNLDNIAGGRNLVALWRMTGEERYKLAFTKLYTGQLVRQPRLVCGNYWHKAIYPHQIWLDGAYMALPFLLEYGLLTNDTGIVRDVNVQLGNIRSLMCDTETGLYYHGYDESRSQAWADKTTGLSQEFWLRSIGWLCAGLADIAELEPDRISCCDMLSELLSAVGGCNRDGMLYQLPARPELKGNYPETSGTLLCAYAALKSARLGIADTAGTGFELLGNVTERFINDEGEIPVLSNICLMGGLGGDQQRDGSADYYLSESLVENDAKGIAPYIMAAAEAFVLTANDEN